VVKPLEGGSRGSRGWLLGGLAALVVVVLVAAVALVIVTRDHGGGEVFLEPASATGTNPFTGSTTTGADVTTFASTTSITGPTGTVAGGATGVTTVVGSQVGLYGGTLNNASCDREQQIAFLQQNPDKAQALASVLGIATSDIPTYLRGLTPVVLLHDTRVTNHGYLDGKATTLQSVLQTGTAVLVDNQGVPRVRCKCGNPLTPPQPLGGDHTVRGTEWPGFSLDLTVVVTGEGMVDRFGLFDVQTGQLFWRDVGTSGDHDTLVTQDEGGRESYCADTPGGAVDKLLAARVAGDRVTAAMCGSTVVLDYLFALGDDFARTLTLRACTPAGESFGTQAAQLCALSNNATLMVVLVPRSTLTEWFASMVIVSDGGGSTGGATASCGTGKPWVTPTTPAEEVLVQYFKALNERTDAGYQRAFALMSPAMQSGFASLSSTGDAEQGFAQFYRDHLTCVTVTSISVASSPGDPEVSASTGIQWYEVQFDDEYSSPFPAGSGQLQPFWKVQADPKGGARQILGSATGL